MKTRERTKRNLQPEKSMTLISLPLPDHDIEDLKEVVRRSASFALAQLSAVVFKSRRPARKLQNSVRPVQASDTYPPNFEPFQ
jgi:hypothetical protein